MKIILEILAIAVLGALLHLWLPWWGIVLPAAAIAFARQGTALKSFGIGFLGAGLLWGGYAFYMDWNNHHLLATKMGALLGGLDAIGMVFATALLGAIIGGLGGLIGKFSREIVA